MTAGQNTSVYCVIWMIAEWLNVVYTTPVMEDNTLEPTEGLEAASEAAVEVLQLMFPEKQLYQGKTDLSSLLAYVVKHITHEKSCIISNMAHMHLFHQLNHSVLLDWQSTCYQEGHITLWPAPMFKLQPFEWSELFDL